MLRQAKKMIMLKIWTPTGLVSIPPEALNKMPQATWADVVEIWEGNSSIGFDVYPGPAHEMGEREEEDAS